ncbi:hypothetical protein PVAP13_9KG480300 [Panicum virgatum]|uniref:Uncharacterized protein n=1 Tax=Panicum virgatum TaxID=38727 RepID=A0A8T0NRZ3_PANVG|nr:hypothetical protein PVAP13_9KG480300 [Panicum virgatum]
MEAAAAHGVLLRDGHHAGHDVQHPGELHPHAVGRGGPRHRQPRHGGRLPARAGLGGDADGLVVQGQLQAVHVAAPPGRLGGAQVGVGEDAEVLVPLAVEVEVVAVAAGEAGVASRHAGKLLHPGQWIMHWLGHRLSHLALQLGLLPLVSPQASCWSGAALQRAAGAALQLAPGRRAGGRTSGCNKERGKEMRKTMTG